MSATAGIGFRVSEIWAFIARDDDGDEGVIAIPTGLGIMPAVAADQARLDSLRPYAQTAARVRGRDVRLVRFSHMTEVEVIHP